MQKSKLKNTPQKFIQNLAGQASQNSNFFEKVYGVVKKIPVGKVATYGEIADILGTKDARKVGFALHANTSSDVSCHRVVDRNGRLAPNFAFNGWKEQRNRLLEEGVSFVDEMHVDLKKCLWYPRG